ncbi:MAG: hypothetical protein HUJ26_14940 [Planctomycetaceae bacterium]|nr:hypothetical protein [Planctomycetaceae bacterium]
MKKTLLPLLFFAFFPVVLTGCGGGDEIPADTSHLETDEAEQEAAKAAAEYEKYGRKGPPADDSQ